MAKSSTKDKATKYLSQKTSVRDKFLRSVKGAIASIRDTLSDKGRYYKFGTDDRLPVYIVEDVNDSGTARICVERLHQFIEGDGFEESVAKKKANPEQTLDALLSDTSLSAGYFPGICLQVKYTAGGDVGSVYNIPVPHVRKKYKDTGQPQLFIYNPLYGDEAKSSFITRMDDKIVPEFGTNKTPAERLELIREQHAKYGEQLGEFLYVYKKGMGAFYDTYPVPGYFSGIDDIRADAALSRLEFRNIANNWSTGIIIQTGPIDDKQKDEETEKTDLGRFNDAMESFTGEDGAAYMHIQSEEWGDQLTVNRIDVEKLMDATEGATDRLAKKICRHMGVPPVLIGIETAGKLGSSQELVDHMKLFNLTVNSRQRMIQEAYNKIWPDMDFSIRPLNLFDFVPDALLDRMTKEELSNIFNVPIKTLEEPGGAPGANGKAKRNKQKEKHKTSQNGKKTNHS